MRSSWGLIIDLGDTNEAFSAEHALYHQFWQDKTPLFKMGDYHGIPQAAEGKVTLQGLEGKAYTKIEQDAIGYPPGWEVPTVFSLSLFGFEENLPENRALRDYLLDFLTQFMEEHPQVRMAAIGNMGSYYLNAEMINKAWVTLQRQDIHTLILSHEHPLTRQLEGESFGERHTLFSLNVLQTLWTDQDFEARHKHYKKEISEHLHTELLPLDWEKPHEN